MDNNLTQIRSSKIKSLRIPLPHFKSFYHKPSSEEDVDERFIGREEISEQLTNWLEDGSTGSYLISGFRGMGKSSFVGKVLYEFTNVDKNKRTIFNWGFIFISGLFSLLLFWVLSWCINCSPMCNWLEIIILGLIIASLCFAFLFVSDKYWIIPNNILLRLRKPKEEKNPNNVPEEKKKDPNNTTESNIYDIYNIWKDQQNYDENLLPKKEVPHKKMKFKDYPELFMEFFRQNQNRLCKIYEIPQSEEKNRKNRIVIKINLGHEILNERDILSLIAKRVYDEYKKYLHDYYAHSQIVLAKKLVVFFFSIILALLVFVFGVRYLNGELSNITKDNLIWQIFKAVKCAIESHWLSVTIVNLAFVTIFYFIFRSLLRSAVRLLPLFKNEASDGSLKELRHLTDRIDTTLNEEGGPNTSYAPSTVVGISFLKKRQKSYAIANVREIEAELVQILEKINNLMFDKPQFIIVFDELDKIDPEYNYNPKQEKENTPEYEKYSDGFPNSMISRKRKQNVLKLLGNMKLFLSSAKAKFIFISGRELYDAYMADLSDREFSISSIFNGAIHVDSFFESTKGQKNIISKTEEYICRQLLPKKYYQKEAIIKLIKDNIDDKLSPDLKLYKKFLDEQFNDNKDEYQFFIDKVILFLYQFTVYLSHISNGSPKKIALFFEKYIKSYYKENTNNPYTSFINEDICNSKYCLIFNQMDQQSIGFVHNIALPVIQAITNKSNQFGDKLLVSASFLVDQIYKHHKGGFSRDNIEYIPELLEVYRTQDLREFINSIITFLRQIHITNIISGLYQYKFRKYISYEISYFSKISEEISAIFNFTLDESLSVKHHYYQQLESNLKQYTQHGANCSNSNLTSNPYTIPLIQQYEVLGELHLLDDEFTDAITKFQSGLQLIKSEYAYQKRDPKDNSSNEKTQLAIILLMIKNVLKLGLAHECQRTHNSAYARYCELLNYLVDFRYVEEESLGLSYGYNRMNSGDEQRKRILFYHTRMNMESVSMIRSNEDEENYKKSKDYLFKREVYPNLMEDGNLNNYSTINYDEIDFVLSGDDLISNLSNPLTPLKSSIISRLTLFEDVQFMYQTILAKLFVLEKIDLSGITQTNLDVAESEFAYMHLVTNSQDKFLLEADFYRKVGAILYFKNGYIRNLNQLFTALKLDRIYDISSDINDYCLNSNPSLSLNVIPMEALNKLTKIPLADLNEISEFSPNFKEEFDKILEKNKGILFSEDEVNIITHFIYSDYFNPPKQVRSGIRDCAERRTCFYKEKRHLPCYACKYLSRSIDVIIKHLFNKQSVLQVNEKQKNFSSVLNFIWAIYQRDAITNKRGSYLSIIASTLRGMGDVQLSCAGKIKEADKVIDEVIKDNFLEIFFGMIFETKNNNLKNQSGIKEFTEFNKLKELSEPLSCLEKSILFYWTASEYFRSSSSLKDSFECLRKILQIFVSYSKEKGRELKECHIKKIKEHIFQKAIISIYTVYDNINIAEIQHLKNMFGTDTKEKMALNKLSNFPDVEELLLLFCELELQHNMLNSSIDCYNSIILSPYRIENSIYEKVFALQFKALVNKKILDDIGGGEIVFDSHELPCQYFKFLSSYFYAKYNLNNSNFIDCIGVSRTEKIEIFQKFEILNFLISDSIFCLTQVVEVLSSAPISQFSNSFIAEIYYRLFEWGQLHRFNHNFSECLCENGNTEEKLIDSLDLEKYLKPLNDIIINRRLNSPNIVIEEKEKSAELEAYYKAELEAYYKNALKAILPNYKTQKKKCEDLKNEKELSYLKDLDKSLLSLIGQGNRHLLSPNYPAEMAYKYYTRALETHTEGAAYKEMIQSMYILDDDINNANITFSLAIERYAINSGIIDEKLKKLEKTYGNATYYVLENFISNKEGA